MEDSSDIDETGLGLSSDVENSLEIGQVKLEDDAYKEVSLQSHSVEASLIILNDLLVFLKDINATLNNKFDILNGSFE